LAVSVVVRFPDGSREFRFPPEPLKEGDVIWHEGRRYRVIQIESEESDRPVVTVELDSDDLGDLLGSERGGIQLVPVD
jgi:hypothetical protein